MVYKNLHDAILVKWFEPNGQKKEKLISIRSNVILIKPKIRSASQIIIQLFKSAILHISIKTVICSFFIIVALLSFLNANTILSQVFFCAFQIIQLLIRQIHLFFIFEREEKWSKSTLSSNLNILIAIATGKRSDGSSGTCIPGQDQKAA